MLHARLCQIGMTALMVAAMRNDQEGIRNLLAAGADMDTKDWIVSQHA
jgi:ankyrin repeat protein